MSGGEYASFSSDGKSLVFVGISDTKAKNINGYNMTFATMSINILDMKSKNIKTIIKTNNVSLDAGYVYSNPSFSPDGKLIAFQHSGSDVSGGFTVIDLKGRTLFSYPQKTSDPTPCWRPQFTLDGKGILCYSPATTDSEKDQIFIIDIKNRTKKLIAEGANPTFACNGEAIVYEKWINKWSHNNGNSQSDLWYLELKEDLQPKLIIKNSSSPSGHYYCFR